MALISTFVLSLFFAFAFGHDGDNIDTLKKDSNNNDTIFWNGTSALEEYLSLDNPLYSFENTGVTIEGVNTHGTWKGYILNMTSGAWLNDSIVDHVIWWHYIVVIIPNELKSNEVGFFWTACADPGSNTNPSDLPKADSDDVIIASFFATHGKIISMVIFTNPNAPIVFSDDPNHKKRSSDSLLAYSFHETMFHPSMPPLFFPMVRANVLALNTVIEWVSSEFGDNFKISQVSAGGASKWGWTTWLFGAIDDRVTSLVPVVFTMLDWNPNAKHQFQSYGGWTFAFQDYWEEGVTAYLDSEMEARLFTMIDPYNFFDKYTSKAKMVVNNGRDEFFMPDDTWLWWDDLPNVKNYLLCPNADHAGITGLLELLPAVATWVEATLFDINVIPYLEWTLDHTNGKITAYTKEIPYSARVWHAPSCNVKYCNGRRDWRALNLDNPCESDIILDGDLCYNDHSLWFEEEINYDKYENGTYYWSYSMEAPKEGYTAFFLDFKFNVTKKSNLGWPIDDYGVFELSTQSMIVNNTLPFPTCEGMACNGTLV